MTATLLFKLLILLVCGTCSSGSPIISIPSDHLSRKDVFVLIYNLLDILVYAVAEAIINVSRKRNSAKNIVPTFVSQCILE